jgi:hypothetical protein
VGAVEQKGREINTVNIMVHDLLFSSNSIQKRYNKTVLLITHHYF